MVLKLVHIFKYISLRNYCDNLYLNFKNMYGCQWIIITKSSIYTYVFIYLFFLTLIINCNCIVNNLIYVHDYVMVVRFESMPN